MDPIGGTPGLEVPPEEDRIFMMSLTDEDIKAYYVDMKRPDPSAFCLLCIVENCKDAGPGLCPL